jgi:rhodanese-related sulfurtransferase
MKNQLLTGILLLCFFYSAQVFSSYEEYPNRALYPEAPFISLEDLHKQKDNTLIVDVRSAYEYDTLRIKGALNIPLNSSDYLERIQALRAKSDKPIAFYCNGKTCRKSYKAARRALRADIGNVTVYDTGIFDWASQYPEDSELLGQSPVQPGQLISTSKFKSHQLEANDFMKKASKRAIVLDVRDPTQRDGLFIFNGTEIPLPLDNDKMQRYIDLAKNQNKPLMIYDAVGKQVRWLQYYLEDQNLKSYYFMKGGAKSFFDNLLSEYQ